MTDTNPRLTRRLRAAVLMLGVIGFMGVIAVVAAFAAGQVALGIVGLAFVGIGIPVAVWAVGFRAGARGDPPGR